ncbi:hypothetical protein KGF56_001453 [Candida oxycetoniae]|uniref:Uncharacterized protein n=1 Tax=Candida oxycetoniae TaxID=497107 RepID=A0AAI9WYY3_9ASCO|nr:uncharacterized protein KGF56_001453 [Candida oxycetoniae]KAI3405846.1 hypothetical protein KGF56_001453 [Candida oxycetoniae]
MTESKVLETNNTLIDQTLDILQSSSTSQLHNSKSRSAVSTVVTTAVSAAVSAAVPTAVSRAAPTAVSTAAPTAVSTAVPAAVPSSPPPSSSGSPSTTNAGIDTSPTTTPTITPNTTTSAATVDKDTDTDTSTAQNARESVSIEEQQRISLKEKNLDEIKQQCRTLIHELEGNQHPEVIIKKHIQQLKKYNELKDVALQLVTLIADQRQVRTTDIFDEMKCEVTEEGLDKE